MVLLALNKGENLASITTLYVTPSVIVVVVGMNDRQPFATVSNSFISLHKSNMYFSFLHFLIILFQYVA